MSSFDISVVTPELARILEDFRISNIYQLNPKTLLLKLRGQEGTQRNLVLEAGRRVHATSYLFEKPVKPPAFCMALRKYLRDGRIEVIRQHGFERIIEMDVAGRGAKYRLVAELFSGGNIVLLDDRNIILQALTYQRMRDRNIVRGEVYAYPPSKGDPRTIKPEDFYELRSMGRLEVVRAIARLLGIGGIYAEEVLLRAGIVKTTPCLSLTDDHLRAIFAALQELYWEVTVGNVKPCIFVDEGGDWVDVTPTPLKRYAPLEYVRFESFNEALDTYYARVSGREQASEEQSLAKQEAERLERILRDQEATLIESKRKAEESKKIGDTIYLHLGELQLLVNRITQEKQSGRSWDQIADTLRKEKSESQIPATYLESLKAESLSVQVAVEGVAFDLDLRLSAQKNAARYFESAKKAKRKMEGVARAIKETKEKIEETKLKSIEKPELAPIPLLERRREWYEKFHWFRSSDGFLAVGGRDASTNEILIKKHTEPHDLVFHAEIQGAPFVVVKTEKKKPSEQAIKEAAQFAASHSRAWKESLGTINVYWVSPQQVSKTPPSGEYLTRGAFMISGSKNYIRGTPLEVAVGLEKEGGTFRVIGGPPDAIARQTSLYVRLVPGRESSGRLAKQVRARLAQAAPEEDRKSIARTPLEEVQRFIPSGRGDMRQ